MLGYFFSSLLASLMLFVLLSVILRFPRVWAHERGRLLWLGEGIRLVLLVVGPCYVMSHVLKLDFGCERLGKGMVPIYLPKILP